MYPLHLTRPHRGSSEQPHAVNFGTTILFWPDAILCFFPQPLFSLKYSMFGFLHLNNDLIYKFGLKCEEKTVAMINGTFHDSCCK